MIIIGSQAIKNWFPEFPREPKDIDIITRPGETYNLITTKKIEVLPNPIILEYCKFYSVALPTTIVHSMNPVGTANIEKLLSDFRNK